MYTEKNILSRAFMIKQVEIDSETEGQYNKAVVTGQRIYKLK